MSKTADRDKALVEEFVDACFGKDAPVTCAMTLTVPDGRRFAFDAIPTSIVPEPDDPVGFELTVQSTRRMEVSRV